MIRWGRQVYINYSHLPKSSESCVLKFYNVYLDVLDCSSLPGLCKSGHTAKLWRAHKTTRPGRWHKITRPGRWQQKCKCSFTINIEFSSIFTMVSLLLHCFIFFKSDHGEMDLPWRHSWPSSVHKYPENCEQLVDRVWTKYFCGYSDSQSMEHAVRVYSLHVLVINYN